VKGTADRRAGWRYRIPETTHVMPLLIAESKF
jgi:hypothetical protein